MPMMQDSTCAAMEQLNVGLAFPLVAVVNKAMMQDSTCAVMELLNVEWGLIHAVNKDVFTFLEISHCL